MRVVIKIGGSLAIGSDGPRKNYFKKILPVLEDIDEEHEVSICIGGGKIVRDYCKNLSWTDLDDYEKEKCLIELIKANVRFISYILDKKPVFEPQDFTGEEVVVGGIEPGRSTDANAAWIAADWDADMLIKMTDIDGIYSDDPDCNERAQKLEKLSFEDLEEVLRSDEDTAPVDYGVLDPTAMKTIKENRIRTVVMDGSEPSKLNEVLNGQRVGTIIG